VQLDATSMQDDLLFKTAQVGVFDGQLPGMKTRTVKGPQLFRSDIQPRIPVLGYFLASMYVHIWRVAAISDILFLQLTLPLTPAASRPLPRIRVRLCLACRCYIQADFLSFAANPTADPCRIETITAREGVLHAGHSSRMTHVLREQSAPASQTDAVPGSTARALGQQRWPKQKPDERGQQEYEERQGALLAAGHQLPTPPDTQQSENLSVDPLISSSLSCTCVFGTSP